MKNWKPNAIIGVEEIYGTSTSPIRVDTNVGKGILKIPSGCGGTDRLISEFIGSCLAKWLGIEMPNFTLIRTGSDFVKIMQVLDGTRAERADGFISQYEKAFSLTPQSIDDVENTDIFTKLVFLDTWTRNPDRFLKQTDGSAHNILLVENGQKRKPYTAKAIDYSEAFRVYDEVFDMKNHFGTQAINDDRIFGQLAMFNQYLDPNVAEQVATQLANVNQDEIQLFMGEIPKSWNLNAKMKKAFVSFIVKRANFVAHTLINKLCLNKSLFFRP